MLRFCLFLMVLLTNGIASGTVKDDSKEDSALFYFDSVEVSLLTCEPHDEVYSLYGHTAIRLVDKNVGNDIAVNFGMFDSSSKHFVLRFIFGLTDYRMGVVPYNYFLSEYHYYGSAVYEQHLNLTNKEKRQFVEALSISARPENVVYRYNFFYNNCTTKARDLILSILDGEVIWKTEESEEEVLSFREMIHQKVEGHPWTSVGNDLLLGFKADRNTVREEREFLPEILMKNFAQAKVKTEDGSVRPLVDSTSRVLQTHDSVVHTGSFPLVPIQCAWIFFAIILLLRCGLTYRFGMGSVVSWFDYAVSSLYATVGIVLFAMIFSQHPTVNANIQILVFNPLLYVLTFPKLRWKYGYTVVALLMVVFFVGNLIQCYAEGMNVMACILFIIALDHILRYYFGRMKKND